MHGLSKDWLKLDPDQQATLQEHLTITGISQNYFGDPYNKANQSADVPDAENTSVWITNLPPDCDHRMLLGAVRGCGKIYACVVNPPTNKVGSNAKVAHQRPHMTAAAKVVFFDRAGVNALFSQVAKGEFKVGGFVPRVCLNRIRSAARPYGAQCRVLHIEGPTCIVNTEFLFHYFCTKFTFELEDVLTLGTVSVTTHPVSDARNPPVTAAANITSLPRARQEWRFGSYRCQAEAARQCIYREKYNVHLSEFARALWQQVSVHFGVDPCAP